jgi:hypothetical protein
VKARGVYSSATPLSTDVSFSYDIYDRLVRTYVDERGLVDYAGLKQQLDALREFVDQLAAASPESAPDAFATDDDRKRYYLTAYNALVLYFAAEAYPSKHALWSRLGFFKDKDIVLGGRKLTLEELEHGIIRKKFLDPRIHFALNCGAASCPPLKARAIADGATETELEDATRTFINDPSNVRFDAKDGVLHLSKIFEWYEDDFLRYLTVNRGVERPHIAEYIRLYLDGPDATALAHVDPKSLRVEYLSYDKSLNEQ